MACIGHGFRRTLVGLKRSAAADADLDTPARPTREELEQAILSEIDGAEMSFTEAKIRWATKPRDELEQMADEVDVDSTGLSKGRLIAKVAAAHPNVA